MFRILIARQISSLFLDFCFYVFQRESERKREGGARDCIVTSDYNRIIKLIISIIGENKNLKTLKHRNKPKAE